MEPRVTYATTVDGFTIAYWQLGEGIPVIIPPPALPWSDIQDELRIPDWRHWYEHLGEHMRVVRYDGRGGGLSERDVTEFSLDAYVRDLEAVVDALGAEKVVLFGVYYSAQVAMAYAARHPERVSKLVLWCAFADSTALHQPGSPSEAFWPLMELNWEIFTETVAHTVFGWSEGDPAHRLAEYMRNSASKETVKAAWIAHQDIDLKPELANIQAPTLVMHRRQFPLVDLAAARELVSLIPDARLALLDGASLAPYLGDMEAAMVVMFQFLDVYDIDHAGTASHHVSRETGVPGFRTILFTDMEGSTEATQQLGDAQAQQMVRTHNRIVRSALHAHGGTEVKHTGDGIMASFQSATLAVEAAIDIQRHLSAEDRLNVRIGVNAGEPVAEGNDLFGTAVQLAARVCARAEPQQILVTDVIRQLVAGKGFLFSDQGETALRGFEDPVRIFEVPWREAGG